MNISATFIERPVATTLLTLGIALAGAICFRLLPVSPLPQVDFPTISVQASLPGASPETMGVLVTGPLERTLGQIPALAVMTSTSSFGLSQITLQFNLNRDIDGAAQDVQAAINQAGSTLPRTLPYPPTYAKINPADTPVMTLALTSRTLPLRDLSDLADTLIGQRLSELPGVGSVSVQGGLKPAVRVQADLEALASFGLSLEDLRSAVAAANVSSPKGSLDGKTQSHAIAANDQITSAKDYAAITIAYRNGAPVLLRDVARIADGFENERIGAWHKGVPAVVVDIRRQPGANIVDTVTRIHAELPRLGRALPADADLAIVSDRTGTIRASIEDVQLTLALSVGLVILVVLLFLRTWSATVIAGTALLTISAKIKVPFYPVPMTLQTFAVMAIAAAYGMRLGVATVLAYLAEGAFGLPVFAGTPGGSGPAYFLGPTGGFLAGFVILAIIVVLVLFLIVVYNRLVSLRQVASQSWSDISVQLKQRHDLVPNLVETVKGYATHERGTLEAVVNARNAAVAASGPAAQAQAENMLSGALRQLFALSEAYPNLKANENFIQLQNELTDIENKIAASRRFFNNSVSEYNAAIQQFPAVLLAGPMGFTARTFFELDESERVAVNTAPQVKF